ncbi:MAG TPA: hypothetical protein VF441_09955 [Acidimicrobiia bacterium]
MRSATGLRRARVYLAALGVVVLGAGVVLIVLLGTTGETSSRHAVHARAADHRTCAPHHRDGAADHRT